MQTEAPLTEATTAAGMAQLAHPLQYAPESRPRVYEEVWLLGLPPLWRYLEFVESTVAGGGPVDRAALTREWCAANDYYQELERTEAGAANEGSHHELDSCLEPLVESVKSHPHYCRVFDTLPTDLEMVELDRLIVSQTHVTRTYVDRLMARIGPAPDAETLFRACLPLDPPEPPVQICKAGPRRYVFRCDSTDLRFHETTVLRRAQLQGYDSFGAIAGVVAAVVGFGYGFLSAVRVGKRMLLNNGYHRACALRALGVTHVPCVIQTATRVDELTATVKGRIAEEAEFYFESARPPLLKDFFDPRIRKLLPIRAQTHIVEVSIEIKHLVEDPLAAE